MLRIAPQQDLQRHQQAAHIDGRTGILVCRRQRLQRVGVVKGGGQTIWLQRQRAQRLQRRTDAIVELRIGNDGELFRRDSREQVAAGAPQAEPGLVRLGVHQPVGLGVIDEILPGDTRPDRLIEGQFALLRQGRERLAQHDAVCGFDARRHLPLDPQYDGEAD